MNKKILKNHKRNPSESLRKEQFIRSVHKKTLFQAAMSYLIRGKLRHSVVLKHEPEDYNIDYNELTQKTLKDHGFIRERHYKAGPILKKGTGRLLFDSRTMLKFNLKSNSSKD